MQTLQRNVCPRRGIREAFQKYHWPHYVQPVTRLRVTSVYRQILREIAKLDDKFVRDLLHRYSLHHITRFKYVSNPTQISALCDLAESDLRMLQLAHKGDHKSLKSVLDLAFRDFGVHESPIRTLIPSWREFDHNSLAYRLNNIMPPKIETFESHRALRKSKNLDFRSRKNDMWLLVEVLRRNDIKTGKNGRKLSVDPVSSPLTPGGLPIAWSRQKNILRKAYALFLRDSPRPVHPMILEHISSQLSSRNISRKTRRRLEECSRSYFSIVGTPEHFKFLQVDLLSMIIPETSPQT